MSQRVVLADLYLEGGLIGEVAQQGGTLSAVILGIWALCKGLQNLYSGVRFPPAPLIQSHRKLKYLSVAESARFPMSWGGTKWHKIGEKGAKRVAQGGTVGVAQ